MDSELGTSPKWMRRGLENVLRLVRRYIHAIMAVCLAILLEEITFRFFFSLPGNEVATREGNGYVYTLIFISIK
jgi:hypothetical protein